jgi:hypothetical protein
MLMRQTIKSPTKRKAAMQPIKNPVRKLPPRDELTIPDSTPVKVTTINMNG